MSKIMNVQYTITKDVYQRITTITEVYKKQGIDIMPETMFKSIMHLGSKYDIDDKLKFHE